MLLTEETEESMATDQVSIKKGLEMFGEDRVNAVVAELRQLDYRNTIEPVHANSLEKEERRRALRYLMYLKRK